MPRTELPNCSVKNCTNQARSHASGICGTHYARERKLHDVRADKPVGELRDSAAKTGCNEPECASPHHAHGYCQKHWSIRYRIKFGQKKGRPVLLGGLK